MSTPEFTLSMQRFVDFLGELGPRWGLDAAACRVHAYLYLMGRPINPADIADALRLDADSVSAALTYLARWRMVAEAGPSLWRVGGDPWEMLMSGLEERRREEIAPALSTLRECHVSALREHAATPSISRRIGAVLDLAEDLAAIDAQARRLSPQSLRRMVGITGRAARFMDRAFGARRGGRST